MAAGSKTFMGGFVLGYWRNSCDPLSLIDSIFLFQEEKSMVEIWEMDKIDRFAFHIRHRRLYYLNFDLQSS